MGICIRRRKSNETNPSSRITKNITGLGKLNLAKWNNISPPMRSNPTRDTTCPILFPNLEIPLKFWGIPLTKPPFGVKNSCEVAFLKFDPFQPQGTDLLCTFCFQLSSAWPTSLLCVAIRCWVLMFQKRMIFLDTLDVLLELIVTILSKLGCFTY